MLVLDDNDEITTRGWTALSHVLCDKSSIDVTYSSNHTLQKLDDGLGGIDHLPNDLVSLLDMNRNNTKAETARQKILEYHLLRDGVNVEAFVDMDVKVLPLAMAWIGRDRTGFQVLFRLLQNAPQSLILT